MSARDGQVGGDHYKKHEIQPWDIIDAYGLGFYAGNAVKYLLRYPDKGGAEDLKKARHYLDKLIEVESIGVPSEPEPAAKPLPLDKLAKLPEFDAIIEDGLLYVRVPNCSEHTLHAAVDILGQAHSGWHSSLRPREFSWLRRQAKEGRIGDVHVYIFDETDVRQFPARSRNYVKATHGTKRCRYYPHCEVCG